MKIREAAYEDLTSLLDLYTNLHDNPMPVPDERVISVWESIVSDENHHVLLGTFSDKLVCSCVVAVIPNLTHGQRPYALVENVITHPEHRHKGYGREILHAARDIARENNCYKIMLLTGAKKESTFRFYEGAGYNQTDKTGFIQWLD